MAANGENGMEMADGDDNDNDMTYEEIMGMSDDVSSSAAGSSRSSKASAAQNPEGLGADSLSSRLVLFRRWLTDEAGCFVHSSLCIVNGDASDGTKNAPVLSFGPPSTSSLLGSSEAGAAGGAGSSGAQSDSGVNGRCGLVDRDVDRVLYDRTMGCQVRAARELRKDEVVLKVPRAAMISPDLIAASDAGRAVLACCEVLSKEAEGEEKADSECNFWDAFGHTATMEKNFMSSLGRQNGTQTLVKILQARRRAARAIEEAEAKLRTVGSNGLKDTDDNGAYKLTESGQLSARAPVLVFILQQRFANSIRPLVAASVDPIAEGSSEKKNAADSVRRTVLPPKTPPTFGPYARTLPPTVHLPVCWKREELALLAGCIPGLNQLQEVAARTMQLASDLIALVESGIIHRFPKLFPPGTFTWDRWVWAASVYTSRALPVSAWLNKGEESAANHVRRDGEWFYSPPHVWDELGVLIPILDMINHESDSNQITWVSPRSAKKPSEGNDGVTDDAEAEVDENEKAKPNKDGEDVPCAVLHRRVKKTGQIYLDYGKKSNEELILHYGFAQINNFSDEVRMGWGLTDAVGDVPMPSDYTAQTLEKRPSAPDDEADDRSLMVFESSDNAAVNGWWTESRLQILSSETNIQESQLTALKGGKKLMAVASNDGSYDPILLAAVVVATMPTDAVRTYDRRRAVANGAATEGLKLTATHQRILRHYLAFIYSRKLERLLQTLNNGLGAHFNSVQLWTKLTEGGLQYDGEAGGNESNASHVGWQSFFDSHAYGSSMEVEKRYYALGPDSCVLTLYDGNLRALQTSLDGILSWSSFEKGVLSQLSDLGFVLLDDDDLGTADEDVKEEMKMIIVKDDPTADTGGNTDGSRSAEGPRVNGQAGATGSDAGNGVSEAAKSIDGDLAKSTEEPAKGQEPPKEAESQERRGSNGGGNDIGNDRGRNRRNRRNRGDRPPAIKLHIGNLSYDTRPCDLYQYFIGLYGKDNVLECHIPMERETGRSRGFGFVTMPEETAIDVLRSGRPHEIEGRPLKVAESNTAGSGKSNRSSNSSSSSVGNADRCANCGYRPKWCTCPVPTMPGFNGPNRPGMGEAYGPPGGDSRDHGPYNRMNRGPPNGDDRRGRRRRTSAEGWDEGRWRSDSRSPSPRGGYKRFRDDRYADHRDGWRSDRYMYPDGYSRSPSPNHNRSRRRGDDREGRDRDRERDPDRERRAGERHRSGRSDRSGSGEWGSRSGRYANRSWSRSRSRSRSRSPERGRKGHHSKGGSSSRRNEDRDGMGPPGVKESEGATERRRDRSRSPSSPAYSDDAAHEPEKKRESKSRPHGEGKSRERSSRRKRSSRSSHRKDGSKRHRSHSRDRSSPSRSWSAE